MSNSAQLAALHDRVIVCRKCARLVRYREEVARAKRRMFRSETYWGRPVPGFGDPHTQLFILGLAPAAHGGNRTGRVFTGDRSGDFLFRMLYRADFTNQPISKSRDDGLQLKNAYVAAAARCAPPGNKPLPEEIRNCRPYLEEELAILQPRALLALGKIAFDSYLALLVAQDKIRSRAEFPFRHGASYALPAGLPRLYAAYHPSQQNTQTGRLTPGMYLSVLRQIRRYLSSGARA
jgi:uracil-DNA glycosylase family 4